MSYALIEVRTPEDWRAYHDIRRTVLFEAKGRFGVYDERFPEEFRPGNHPLLLKLNGEGLGTTRLDELGEGRGVVRLVAIRAGLQRQGHGRELSALVEARARDMGIRTLFVNAAPDAIGFYEKMGWSRFSWDPSELRNISKDNVQMRKLLD